MGQGNKIRLMSVSINVLKTLFLLIFVALGVQAYNSTCACAPAGDHSISHSRYKIVSELTAGATVCWVLSLVDKLAILITPSDAIPRFPGKKLSSVRLFFHLALGGLTGAALYLVFTT